MEKNISQHFSLTKEKRRNIHYSNFIPKNIKTVKLSSKNPYKAASLPTLRFLKVFF